MEMRITVESGLHGDGFNVYVTDGEKPVFQEKYRYGHNVSASRADAMRNERDRELAVTCHWERIPCEKPYVKDPQVVRNLRRFQRPDPGGVRTFCLSGDTGRGGYGRRIYCRISLKRVILVFREKTKCRRCVILDRRKEEAV